jgi:PhzF family phenazine biosynthesis protein
MQKAAPIYLIDAFAQKLFQGNPAAVVPLSTWLPDERLQAIAAENNQSETAFLVPGEANAFGLRWFTPTKEVDLCGHATLATAHALWKEMNFVSEELLFDTKSGWLKVYPQDTGAYTLVFPADTPEKTELPAVLTTLFTDTVRTYKGKSDLMVVLKDEDAVESFQPDFEKIAQIPFRGLIITALGKKTDIVSRCFYPQFGIPEDPVTGSAHTLSGPYWQQQLQKNNLTARQASARNGFMELEIAADRVLMTGHAFTYMKGVIQTGY